MIVVRKMFPEERQEFIIKLLNRQGRCRVTDLARELGVSEVTIRQDLDVLETRGLLCRTHGGAILPSRTGFERPFQSEETSFYEEKERIGRAAAEMVTDGQTVILDVGTTVTAAARRLKKKEDLLVITNALNIALLLEDNPGITVIVTGGTLRAKQHSLVNPYGGFILDEIRADVAILGAGGIEAESGVTNVNIAEAEIKSLFIKAARRRFLLCDSRKVGNIALAKVADLEEIDFLFTDKQADPEEIARLRERGLAVKLV